MSRDKQQSLYELGNILIALHRKGYVAGEGYSFAAKDNQFGEGAIYVCAACIPPPDAKPMLSVDEARPWWRSRPWQRFWRKQ